MGFRSEAASFIVTDADGNTKFDSTLRNFLETDYASGSFSIPRRDLENNAISTTANYINASVNAASNVVLGAAKIVRADSFATGLYELVPVDTWNCVGGTLILGTGRCSYTTANKVNGDGYAPTGIQTLTFLVESGVLKAREVFIGHEVPTAAITATNFVGTPAWTVYYKLVVGVFDR